MTFYMSHKAKNIEWSKREVSLGGNRKSFTK